MEEQVCWSKESKISEPMRLIIEKMLHKNPKEWITLDEISKILDIKLVGDNNGEKKLDHDILKKIE